MAMKMQVAAAAESTIGEDEWRPFFLHEEGRASKVTYPCPAQLSSLKAQVTPARGLAEGKSDTSDGAKIIEVTWMLEKARKSGSGGQLYRYKRLNRRELVN
jgi:hypothetical protein